MAGQWYSPGTPVSSTNKTNCHDITEILLKVALNTITPVLIFISDDEEQEHEFIKVMTELLTDLHLGTTPNKINRVWHEQVDIH